MKEFNIWDLERVHIRVKEEFFDKINKNIFLKFKTKSKAYHEIFCNKEVPFTTFKNLLKKCHNRDFFIPLKFYLKLLDFIGVSKKELQKNIVAYKTGGGVNYIENPLLPIKITPVFDMLFAHHIGDGTVINPKRGRLPYFGYRQFNNFYRENYIHKIENVFGKIKFKKNYISKSTRSYCPPVLSTLFFKYYIVVVNDFLSDRARINFDIVDGKESLLSILLGFIIDEGNIDSTQIMVKLKNKLLILDLGKICRILEYKYTIVHGRGENEGFSYLHILRKGMKKLYSDYIILNHKYPVIDLGIKGKKIKKSFKIYNRPIIRKKGNSKIILDILKKEQLSVNQLANRVNMTRQGVRYHIHNLIKDKKIKLIDDSQSNWVYGKI